MLYTDHAKYEEGVSPTTIPILYVSESLSSYFPQAFRYFYKNLFPKTKANAKPTSLNDANDTLARSLWI
jgi:hypothetical protein